MTRRTLLLLLIPAALVVLVAGVAWAEWVTTGSGSGSGVAGTWATTTTAPPGPEVCDGVDNDHNGEVDDGLGYCFDGTPAPNTDGEACLDGFADLDGDPFNGCEETEPPAGGPFPEVLPFGVAANVGAAHICLIGGGASDDPQVEPCFAQPSAGNAWSLETTLFGLLPETTLDCRTSGHLALNIALGVDHPLGAATNEFDGPWTDQDACDAGAAFDAQPYTLEVNVGNIASSVMEGLVSGTGSVPGRLAVQTGTGMPIGRYEIDDTPLWSILNATGRSYCDPRGVNGTSGVADTHDDMVACISTYVADSNPPSDGGGPLPLFDAAISDSARLVWMPQFWATGDPVGVSELNVKGFQAYYLQTSHWGCGAATCEAVHDPGEPLVGEPRVTSTLDAASAIRLPVETLPGAVLRP